MTLSKTASPIRAISREGTPPPEPLANNTLSSWGNVPWADLGGTAASTHQALRGQCSWPVGDFIIPLSFNLPDFFLEESGFWTQILSLLGMSVHMWENKISPLRMAVLLACRVQSLLSQAVLPVLWVPPVCQDHSQEKTFEKFALCSDMTPEYREKDFNTPYDNTNLYLLLITLF